MKLTLSRSIFLFLLLTISGCHTTTNSGNDGSPPPKDNPKPDHGDNSTDHGEVPTPTPEPDNPGPGPDAPVSTGPVKFGRGILFFAGNGGVRPGTSYNTVGDMKDALKALNDKGIVTVTTEIWPTDMSPYSAVVWFAPGARESAGYIVPAETVKKVSDYVMAGGRLVVAGDINVSVTVDGQTYNFAQANKTIDALSRSLGIDIQLVGTVSRETTCDVSKPHPLFAAGPWSGAGAVTQPKVGPAAKWGMCQVMGIQSLGKGEVIVSGDVTVLSTWVDWKNLARLVEIPVPTSL